MMKIGQIILKVRFRVKIYKVILKYYNGEDVVDWVYSFGNIDCDDSGKAFDMAIVEFKKSYPNHDYLMFSCEQIAVLRW